MGAGPTGQSYVANVWQHGIKVFNLHKDLPISGMTAGIGHFGPASISTVAKDLRLILSRDGEESKLDPKTYSIEQVVGISKVFFESRYAELDPQPASPSTFEFWIGGYGANGARGQIWKLTIENGVMIEPSQIARPEDDAQIAWGGQSTAINRLLIGFDGSLKTALINGGLPEQDAAPLIEQLKQQTQTPLVHAAMPIQDAINLAEFLVDVTKRYFAFLPGADIVGGDTDIATVTKHEGFKWIRRKHYYPASLNPRETDHVA